MGFIKEFRDFAMKGNLVDIAVAFVMGAAFGKVVSSFTDGVVSPLIGLLGGSDLSSLTWEIKKGTIDASGNLTGGVYVAYGAFISAIINFVIVALVMFMVIKAVNSMKKKDEAAPAGPSSTDALLMEIRDALKK